MRSAQRQRRLNNKARKSSALFLIKILIFPVLLVLIFLFLKISTKYWNGDDKLSLVFREPNGDVAVTILDPKLSEETTMIIPGDTEVDVAGNLGTLRIKNVWQLAINEKLDGKLLAATVSKNFLFPVFLWSDSDAKNLNSPSLPGIFQFIIAPKKTNIPLGDRVMASFFALSVKSINKTEINLGESRYLQKKNLNDGQTGYVPFGTLSDRLTVYFSDNDFADKNLRVEITDATAAFGISDNVGQIIQVLGGKVVSVDKVAVPQDYDCYVLGKDSRTIVKVANIFGCKISKEATDFDLEIKIGKAFAKRF